MQIACFGFAGSAALEGEAGAELVRLERFAKRIAGCHSQSRRCATTVDARSSDARLDPQRDYENDTVEH